MVTWLPNFLGWVVYHIFLPMVLSRCASRARAPPLNYYYYHSSTKTQSLEFGNENGIMETETETETKTESVKEGSKRSIFKKNSNDKKIK